MTRIGPYGHTVPPSLLVVLVAVLVTGCGGVAVDAPSGSRALPVVDVNPRPAGALRDGGTLRWGVTHWVTQWNRLHVDGARVEADTIERAILPRMYRSAADGTVTPNPAYLRSAEVTRTAPRQVVTYRINPRAHWSTGAPITWRDFRSQWRAMRGRNPAYRISSAAGYERIAEVARGDDAREVVVTFARPFAEWLKLFDPLYPASCTASPERFDDAYRDAIPVTAGPFTVAGIDRTARTLTLARDPEWWGAPPKLDRIVVRALDAAAIPAAFAGGELDYARIGTDAAAYRRVRGVPGGVVRRAAGPGYRTLTFGSRGILHDPRLRRAIALGIDRRAIAAADLHGLDWPSETMDNHFFVTTQQGYADTAGTAGRFAPAAARRRLDGLGWRRTGPVRTRRGRPLEITFVIPGGVPVARREAAVTRSLLADIGVRVRITPVPGNDLYGGYVVPGRFDIAPFTWIGTPFPISGAASVYRLPHGADPRQNFGRIGSPRIDAWLDRAQSELDPAAARADLTRADRLIWQAAHSLVVYQRPQYTAVRANLANIGSWGLRSPDFTTIGFLR